MGLVGLKDNANLKSLLPLKPHTHKAPVARTTATKHRKAEPRDVDERREFAVISRPAMPASRTSGHGRSARVRVRLRPVATPVVRQ